MGIVWSLALAKADLNLDLLLRPISTEGKSTDATGAGRYYGYEYLAFEEARAVVEPTAVRGDGSDPRAKFEREAKSADWGKILKLAKEVLTRESKDLQVAAWLIEALGQTRGFPGLRDGFELIRRLQEDYWHSAYPVFEVDDPQRRQAPYEFLADPRILPLLIRRIPLIDGSGGRRNSYLRYAEAKKSEELVKGYNSDSDEGNEEYRRKLLDQGRIFPEDWESSVNSTSLMFLENVADELGDCFSAFKAWERSTDKLFDRAAPSLREIREAFTKCSDLVVDLLKQKESSKAERLKAVIRKAEADPAEAEDDEEEEEIEDVEVPDPEAPRYVERPSEEVADARPVKARRPEAPSPGPGGAPTDPQEAYRRILEATDFLREKEPENPVSYLVVRALWAGQLYGLGRSPKLSDLVGPGRETRIEVARLADEERWDQLIESTERAIGGLECRGWLDVHRLAILALEKSNHEAAARACRSLLNAILEDYADLPERDLDDRTPAASPETRAWLSAQGPRRSPSNSSPPAVRSEPQAAPAIDAVDARVAELLKEQRFLVAVRLRMSAVDPTSSDRDRFFRRLRLAETCLAAGYTEEALPLIEDLARQIDERGLESWEGSEFAADVARLLYKGLLDLKRSDTAQRLEVAHDRLSRLDPAAALEIRAKL